MPTLQSVSAIVLLALVIGATPALAAERGLCLTPEAMTQTLAAEGQRSIAHAQVLIKGRKPSGMIFTMSADGKVGYVLEADEPIGTRATKICVFERVQNIHLFDPRKPETPPHALILAPDAQAEKVCAKDGGPRDDTCQPLNQVIRTGEQWGQRVLMRAENVAKRPDGSFSGDGTLTVIIGALGWAEKFPNSDETERGKASVWQVILPEGAAYLRLTMAFMELTPHGEAVLDGRAR